MGVEEQKEEREVLDSIFPDEIQDVNESEYRVSIRLDTEDETEEAGDDDEPIILLNVRYPEAYPDEAPMLDITQPPNAPKLKHLDLHQDKARLLESLEPSIEENMGMAMVFTLVSTLKESAEELVRERQQAIQAVKDQEKAKAEEEENRKFEGQKVTRETFLAWMESFKQEMAEESARRQAELEAEEKKKRGNKSDEKKLTGKQLWEQGLAGKAGDEEEDGEDVVDSVQRLQLET